MRAKDLAKFIQTRERHRVVKEGYPGGFVRAGKADAIISKYRFCNVRRNDDRVTKWIHEFYLNNPEWEHREDLWFALVVARLFNNEDTLAAIKRFVLPFKAGPMLAELHRRAAAGKKNFNAAYIVSTNGVAMDKPSYIVTNVLDPMWADRVRISKLVWVGQLANAHIALSSLYGLKSFMAAQVLADLKYAARGHVWEDFHTFAASGPGSKRGLNRVLGRPIDAPLTELQFRENLRILRDAVNLRLNIEPLTAQDIQNCLCEFDKYERARLNEGEPKQLYKPKG